MVLRRPERKPPREKRPDKDRTPKPPKPEAPVDIPSKVQPSGSILARLTGNVRTHRPNSRESFAVPWANVGRYAAIFEREASRYGLDPLLLAGMALIESDSNQFWPGTQTVITRDDGFGDGLSVGLMQVKPRIWQPLVPSADAYTVGGNVGLGAAIMADAIRRHGSWERGLTLVYFPSDDPNGTTQGGYVACLRSLMAEMRNQTQPAPVPDPDPPKPPRPSDPLAVVFGGAPARVEYGFGDDVGLNYYGYGVGHGTNRSTQHTGDDVLVPDNTPLYSPAPGIVTCVGWSGNPTWGQGCGYFEDEQGGIGNISILLDAGVKVVLGHSSRATVRVGQRVKSGERVGTSGGMNGPHTHLEVATERRGTYWLLDPLPALREAMKGEKPLPPDVVYAERVPVPQPSELTTFAKVIATRSGVPVLQRGYAGAPAVRAPLEQGEDFEACFQVIGDDERIYWISSLGSRIPVDGTESEDWPA